MRLITEAEVAAVLNPADAADVLRMAFAQLGRGEAQVLARHRASCTYDGMNLAISTMGAILETDNALPGVLGTKVYSAHNGKYNFLVNLFLASTGRAIATIEANEFTRLRTAAATAVAAGLLARQDARTLAIFGAGIQGRAHAEALIPLRPFERVLVCARSGAEAFARDIEARFSVPAQAMDAPTAASQADVIVTATRSATPLFDGRLVKPGAFVGAVGSSTKTARELDDVLLGRAARIVVEWRTAAEQEAGDIVQAAPGVIAPERLVELGDLVLGGWARGPDDIVVYKSVGIGLEDVALARFVAYSLELC